MMMAMMTAVVPVMSAIAPMSIAPMSIAPVATIVSAISGVASSHGPEKGHRQNHQNLNNQQYKIQLHSQL